MQKDVKTRVLKILTCLNVMLILATRILTCLNVMLILATRILTCLNVNKEMKRLVKMKKMFKMKIQLTKVEKIVGMKKLDPKMRNLRVEKVEMERMEMNKVEEMKVEMEEMKVEINESCSRAAKIQYMVFF
jgi:hypothetical protein